jgi:hypothetical protein
LVSNPSTTLMRFTPFRGRRHRCGNSRLKAAIPSLRPPPPTLYAQLFFRRLHFRYRDLPRSSLSFSNPQQAAAAAAAPHANLAVDQRRVQPPSAGSGSFALASLFVMRCDSDIAAFSWSLSPPPSAAAAGPAAYAVPRSLSRTPSRRLHRFGPRLSHILLRHLAQATPPCSRHCPGHLPQGFAPCMHAAFIAVAFTSTSSHPPVHPPRPRRALLQLLASFNLFCNSRQCESSMTAR